MVARIRQSSTHTIGRPMAIVRHAFSASSVVGCLDRLYGIVSSWEFG
jgi:hypothetical protein